MGRKQDSKSKKVEEVEQSVEESVQEDDVQDDIEDDLQNDVQDQDMVDESVLLKKIQDKILNCDQDQKLTWGAIYSIKEKQGKLNQDMQKEIEQIKEKYQKLRMPFMNQISDAVSGKNIDKTLYTQCQFTKNINLTKTKPKALRQYWSKVFQSCGLVGNEDDIELFDHLLSFKCELLDAANQNIRIVMQFEKNQYIQKSIEIKVEGKVGEGTFKKKVNFIAKNGKTLDQNSLFGLLTSASSDDQELQQTCLDLYRAYFSSVYFYFFQHKQGQDYQGDQQGDQQEQDQQEDDDIKAVKKTKGSAITEKPECKNQ